jgi:hypothetical protein
VIILKFGWHCRKSVDARFNSNDALANFEARVKSRSLPLPVEDPVHFNVDEADINQIRTVSKPKAPPSAPPRPRERPRKTPPTGE